VVTVASLPPRPPPASLPPHPTRARPDTSNRREWHGIRVKFARLQYRDNEDQAWSTVADSYETELDTSNVPEAYNVEQVYFLETGKLLDSQTAHLMRLLVHFLALREVTFR